MQNSKDTSLSLAAGHDLQASARVGMGLAGIGLLILALAALGVAFEPKALWLSLSLLLILGGTSLHAWGLYMQLPAGIKNHGVWMRSLTNAGLWGWMLGVILTGFYVLLYWFPELLGLGREGAANHGIVALFDPFSMALKGKAASQWFLYGTLYTLAIVAMGIKFILKYRHNRYQVIRTLSVMFFQTAFAFFIPELLERLSGDKPYIDGDLKGMWPLNYDFFFDWHLNNLFARGNFGLFMLGFGLAMIFLISPLLTYFYGKRWYCSWVCGCGALAETAGDPFRQLSDKSRRAWKIERWLIHAVLLFAVLMTIAVVWSWLAAHEGEFWLGKTAFAGICAVLLLFAGLAVLLLKDKIPSFRGYERYIAGGLLLLAAAVLLVNAFSDAKQVLFINSFSLRKSYGFLIGAAFSGVIGVGFYPLMGSRVWCRFGCPMAAILGIQQKLFSRFRITTNNDQCISCGNCSAYCEMGIDVRAYAQRGENIVRASCVGCGICSAVCPRGVLRLENGPDTGQSRNGQASA